MFANVTSAADLRAHIDSGGAVYLNGQIVDPKHIVRIEQVTKDVSYKYYLTDGNTITVNEIADLTGVSVLLREALSIARRPSPAVVPDTGLYVACKVEFQGTIWISSSTNYNRITSFVLADVLNALILPSSHTVLETAGLTRTAGGTGDAGWMPEISAGQSYADWTHVSGLVRTFVFTYATFIQPKTARIRFQQTSSAPATLSLWLSPDGSTWYQKLANFDHVGGSYNDPEVINIPA